MAIQSFRPNEGKLIYPNKSFEKTKVGDSLEAFEFALQFYDEETIQHHITTKVLLLNGNNTVLGVVTISEPAHTYDILKNKFIQQAAILANDKSIILVSNSPDRSLEAESRELQLKNQVKVAVRLFNITLGDYMLITSEDYYSLADHKIL